MVVLVKIREKFTTKMESNGISLPVCCWCNDTFSLFPLSLSPTSHFTFSFPLNHRKVFANLIISEPGRS